MFYPLRYWDSISIQPCRETVWTETSKRCVWFISKSVKAQTISNFFAYRVGARAPKNNIPEKRCNTHANTAMRFPYSIIIIYYLYDEHPRRRLFSFCATVCFAIFTKSSSRHRHRLLHTPQPSIVYRALFPNREFLVPGKSLRDTNYQLYLATKYKHTQTHSHKYCFSGSGGDSRGSVNLKRISPRECAVCVCVNVSTHVVVVVVFAFTATSIQQ